LAEQPIQALIRGLDLKLESEDVFLGDPGEGKGRLFG